MTEKNLNSDFVITLNETKRLEAEHLQRLRKRLKQVQI